MTKSNVRTVYLLIHDIEPQNSQTYILDMYIIISLFLHVAVLKGQLPRIQTRTLQNKTKLAPFVHI